MGQSTDAILFYGYAWDDESVWWEIPEAARDLRDLYGATHDVLVDRHCSGDYPMPYVYVTATRTIAWRGHVRRIHVDDMQNEGLWDAQLHAFCGWWGIDVEGIVPGWHLVSLWS